MGADYLFSLTVTKPPISATGRNENLHLSQEDYGKKCCNEMRWYLADTTAFYHFLLFWPPVVAPFDFDKMAFAQS